VRKNFITFEKALGLFSPFASPETSDGKTKELTSAAGAQSTDEIATLKAELTAMQQRLEQLSRR
jgi:polyhydroxyalkanoate synthesis regulator protein